MVPKVQSTVDARNTKIAEDLATAKASFARADELEEQNRAREAEARAAAQAIVAEAKAKGKTFNDGKPFDAAACIAQRREQAVTGEIRARGESGPSFTPEQDAAYEIIAHADTRKAVPALAKAWIACKGMTSGERKTVMLDALTDMPEAFRDHVTAKALDAITTRASLAALLA